MTHAGSPPVGDIQDPPNPPSRVSPLPPPCRQGVGTEVWGPSKGPGGPGWGPHAPRAPPGAALGPCPGPPLSWKRRGRGCLEMLDCL